MQNPTQIEDAYREFSQDLRKWMHDGITLIDMKFLHEQGLLASLQEEQGPPEDLSQYFHVIESIEKVTLFNDQFIVWIIPKMEGEEPITTVLIALNQSDKAHLEVVFMTRGVYNTPRHVLKVLQYFLADMTETEQTLTGFEKNG